MIYMPLDGEAEAELKILVQLHKGTPTSTVKRAIHLYLQAALPPEPVSQLLDEIDKKIARKRAYQNGYSKRYRQLLRGAEKAYDAPLSFEQLEAIRAKARAAGKRALAALKT